MPKTVHWMAKVGENAAPNDPKCPKIAQNSLAHVGLERHFFTGYKAEKVGGGQIHTAHSFKLSRFLQGHPTISPSILIIFSAALLCETANPRRTKAGTSPALKGPENTVAGQFSAPGVCRRLHLIRL